MSELIQYANSDKWYNITAEILYDSEWVEIPQLLELAIKVKRYDIAANCMGSLLSKCGDLTLDETLELLNKVTNHHELFVSLIRASPHKSKLLKQVVIPNLGKSVVKGLIGLDDAVTLMSENSNYDKFASDVPIIVNFKTNFAIRSILSLLLILNILKLPELALCELELLDYLRQQAAQVYVLAMNWDWSHLETSKISDIYDGYTVSEKIRTLYETVPEKI